MLKDFWASVLLFQVGVFRQLMNEAFSVWDSKYLTGKFRKICASEFSRPLRGKKKKQNLKKNHLFCRQETRKHRKEEREWETQGTQKSCAPLQRAVVQHHLLCSMCSKPRCLSICNALQSVSVSLLILFYQPQNPISHMRSNH